MEYINEKIKEARERAPDLIVVYAVEPFEVVSSDGSVNIHHNIDVAAALSIDSSNLRSNIIMQIETCLHSKIDSIKIKLKKLGVKLEEKIEEKPEEILRLTGPKIRRVK
jgi:hypothetical protein